jgi:hypothetical protein
VIPTEDKVTLARKRAELVDLLAAPLPTEDRVRIQGELSVVNAQIKALNTTEAARNKAAADRRKVKGLAEAQANAARARAKIDDGAEDDDDPGQTKAIGDWIAAVLRRGGLKAIRLSDGKLLVDGPPKWCAVVDVLCAGIYAAARGQELPDIPVMVTESKTSKAKARP